MKTLKISAMILLTAMTTAFAQKHMAMDVNVDDTMGQKKIIIMKKGMNDDLKLTADQEKKFAKTQLDFEQQKLPFKQKIESKELEFKAELLNDKPSKQTLFTIIDAVSQFRAELLKKDIEEKYALRDLLNDEQKDIWDKGPGQISLDTGCFCMQHIGMDAPMWITNDQDIDLDLMEGEGGMPKVKVEKKVLK